MIFMRGAIRFFFSHILTSRNLSNFFFLITDQLMHTSTNSTDPKGNDRVNLL